MEPLPDLPPKVPEELAELDRALQLLGAVCQAGSIKGKHHAELEALLGCKVTQQLASHWKKQLKEIRRDVAAELKKETPDPRLLDTSNSEQDPTAGGIIRRMPREEICDGLRDDASDLRDALDSLASGLRDGLGVAVEHVLFHELATARRALDRMISLLGIRAIHDGDATEAPAARPHREHRQHKLHK